MARRPNRASGVDYIENNQYDLAITFFASVFKNRSSDNFKELEAVILDSFKRKKPTDKLSNFAFSKIVCSMIQYHRNRASYYAENEALRLPHESRIQDLLKILDTPQYQFPHTIIAIADDMIYNNKIDIAILLVEQRLANDTHNPHLLFLKATVLVKRAETQENIQQKKIWLSTATDILKEMHGTCKAIQNGRMPHSNFTRDLLYYSPLIEETLTAIQPTFDQKSEARNKHKLRIFVQPRDQKEDEDTNPYAALDSSPTP